MTALAGVLLVLAFVLWPAPDPLTRAAVSRGLGAGPASASDGEATGRGGTSSAGGRLRRLLRREVRLGRSRPGWAADFAELAAVGLDAGLPSAQAAVLACAVGATSRPELQALADRLVEVDAQGGAVGECLARCADDDSDLRFLAASWQLTDEFGVAAAPAARTAAGVLRERTAADERRTVLAAGPRASMWLLTLLPLSGPVVEIVLGLPVAEVYGGVAAALSATVGLLLTGGGWLWSRRLLRRAVRPARVR